MNNWVKKTLKEASINIIDGDRGLNYPKKNEFYSSEYCLFLNTGNVTKTGFNFNNLSFITKEKDELLRKGKLKRKDIVLTTRGTVGNVGYFDNKIIYSNIRINSGMVILRVDEKKISPYFLYLFLRSEIFSKQVLKQGSGSAQPQLPIQNLNNIIFPWFNLSTQKQIAKVLSDLDAKIEVNNKINTELEAMAKTLYDYWFVQFDFPKKEGKPYKASGGKMVFNEALKRDIPEGWEVDKLGTILKTELGGTPSTKVREFWKGKTPWLNSGEIANFPIIQSEEKITKEAISNSATSLIPKGSCVLSITRHLRPSILGIDACANQSVVGILESDKFKSSFIYPFLVNEIPRLMKLRTGAQQPHINKKTVDVSLVINPYNDILKDYYKIVNPIYDQIVTNSFQNQKLSELRDWLLPMLMNGQVRVGENSLNKE